MSAYLGGLNLSESDECVYSLHCPGCDEVHRFTLAGKPDLNRFSSDGPLRFTSSAGACHSRVSDGQWEFLPTSTHRLAGQTSPMVPLTDAEAEAVTGVPAGQPADFHFAANPERIETCPDCGHLSLMCPQFSYLSESGVGVVGGLARKCDHCSYATDSKGRRL